MINKVYCMSSYLTFRFIQDENINFFDDLKHTVFKPKSKKMLYGCSKSEDIDEIIRYILSKEYIPGKTAILLSGGMDSAILASYLPEGTTAYTLRCVSENAIDETKRARKHADKYKLKHKIVDVTWEDYLKLTPKIMKFDGVPVHSIEPQLYKVGLIAKNEGVEKLIIGAASDLVFGGMDKLLSKDWKFDEFLERYTFIKPAKVLKEYISMEDIYEEYRIDNEEVDFLRFMQEISLIELQTSYMRSFNCAKIGYIDPYSYMYMTESLDLEKVRNGKSKYLIRELFSKRYPEIEVPEKIPLPRSLNDWLKDYRCPVRREFNTGFMETFTGDQKWLVYCLEWFLNLYDRGFLS